MKGAIFTILQEMIEEKMSVDLWDQLIEECDLPSQGIYTSAASYDDEEVFTLVARLVEKTGLPAENLLETFGEYLFLKLHSGLPTTVSLPDNFFDYMEKVDSVIHVEVKKLDRNAETPEISVLSRHGDKMIIKYFSEKKLCYLAIGLLKGAAAYFDEKVDIEMPICMHDGSHCCQLVLQKAAGEKPAGNKAA